MRLLATLGHGLLQSIARLARGGERAAQVCSDPGAAAETRANSLLLRVLTPRQREEFARSGYFAVEVAGRGKFVILPHAMFNIGATCRRSGGRVSFQGAKVQTTGLIAMLVTA